jgi:insulysin
MLSGENGAHHLDAVSKDDVLQFFMSRVHPKSSSRAKFSIHLVSQKEKPVRLSSEAVDAFIASVRDAGIDINEATWKEALGNESTPLMDDFVKYWNPILESVEQRNALLSQLPIWIEKYPIPGEGKDPRLPGVTYIEDLRSFRSGLEPSVDPSPLVQWGDLPVSRF